MPSVRYYNQTAPFWDFIASMEEQGSSHPFSAFTHNNESPGNQHPRPNPWTEGWAGFPFGPLPHRGGRHDGTPHHPDRSTGTTAPEPEGHAAPSEKAHDPEEGSSDSRPAPPPSYEGPHHGPGHHHRSGPDHGPDTPRGRCGGRGRGAWGGRGRGQPFGTNSSSHPGGFGALAEMFQSQFFGGDESGAQNKQDGGDFKPEYDVFDTPESFVVHISLPGAKKEDVGVSFDAEKSELNIAGVVHRPGDEEFLKTLAMAERKVGAFERKVRLGSRASPAQVDVDGISAKMEDGVLRIEVPKLDSGYVDIKKVDIE